MGTDFGQTYLKRRARFFPLDLSRYLKLDLFKGQVGVPFSSKQAFDDLEFLMFSGITALVKPRSFFSKEVIIGIKRRISDKSRKVHIGMSYEKVRKYSF